jgi:regulatory protein
MTSVITSIERLKDKQRYNIYIDEQFAFGVHEDVLIRHRLHKGQTIDAAAIQAIVEEEERQQAYVYALKWLGAKVRTTREILERLRNRGFTEEAAQEAVRRLERQRYVDDADFAKHWTLERANAQKKGKRLIARELQAKGIADSHIREALKQLDEADEWETVMELAKKKWRNVSDPEEEVKQMQRVYAFLIRRGFPPQLAGRAIRAVAADRRRRPDESE